jgi:hypothetical protein
MLLFRSEEHVQRWCTTTGRPPGAMMPLAQVWRLARLWYGDRLDPDWQPRTAEEAQAILTRVGLTGEFWQLQH